MKKYQGILAVAIALIAVFGFESCSPANGNSPGSEYMPDMGHSIAYEANTYNYYYQNTWNAESEKSDNSGFSRMDLTLHNLPVNGTIPRGYAGVINTKTGNEYAAKMKELRGETTTNAVAIPVNGQVPYYIPNTEEGATYAATAAELRQNPYPISARGLEEGKELYEVYCGVCHGNKGDGNGWLVDEANKDAKYLAAPTSYLTDDMVNAENGRFYHTIMHGKGVMGSYADKLSYEERWQVIHYIRSIQAKDRKLAYSPYENTLNTWATPITDSDWPVDLSRSKLAKNVRKAINTEKATKKEFVLENVFFDTGSATLKVESKQELNELAEILREYASAIIEVGGHTDNTGTPEGNETLSDARANVVKTYLEGKGIATERLEAKGYGQTSPIAKNNTETGRAKNRRTAFTVLSK